MSPKNSEHHRKSHVNVGGPSSPIMERNYMIEHRLSNEYERSKTAQNFLVADIVIDNKSEKTINSAVQMNDDIDDIDNDDDDNNNSKEILSMHLATDDHTINSGSG